MKRHIKTVVMFSIILIALLQTETSAQYQLTWRQLNPGSTENLVSVKVDEDTVAVSIWLIGDKGTMFRSHDGGETWEKFSHETHGMKVFSAVFYADPDYPRETAGVAVGQNGTAYVFKNSGEKWKDVSTYSTQDLNKVTINEEAKKILLYAVGNSSNVRVSADSGDTWVSQSTPYQYDNLYDVQFKDNTGWIVGSTGIIYKTTDEGSNWNYVVGSPSNPNFYGVGFHSSSHGWVCGTNGTILHTNNGGSTWTAQNTGTTKIYTDIEADKGGADTMNICAAGGDGNVVITYDGGNTWYPQNIGYTGTINAIQYDANHNIWLVGNNGTIITSAPKKPPVGVDDIFVPTSYELFPAYPNPFNPMTKINYTLLYLSHVKITIHDALGRLVTELVNEEKLPGNHIQTWDASGMASGVYSCRIIALNSQKNFIKAVKMVLLK